jgi:hypothetical protein
MNGPSPNIKHHIWQGLVKKCQFILLEAFKSMKEDNFPHLWEMEEDAITANLVKYMNKVPEARRSGFIITPQHPIYSDEVLSGASSPRKSPIVDIRLACWTLADQFSYHVEAKNLSEKDWKKSNGAGVNASYYRRRYIETGIDHIVSGHYHPCCLAGYIVNGKSASIASAINEMLITLSRESEILRQNGHSESFCTYYCSSHPVENHPFIIEHFFLLVNE